MTARNQVMTERLPLRFKGAPGSPYTRKMLALLRYRHIPHELLLGRQAEEQKLPRPKVELLPTFYLPNADGVLEAVVDSTPLIRRFEREFSDRAVIADDPVLAFVDGLLEDYGDEWLTKAMFHYRWSYAADIAKAGRILPLWRNPGLAPEPLEAAARMIADRQISRLYVVGSNPVTQPVIEASYVRCLDILERLLQRQPFLLGQRPGAADFAIYAQLTQLAKFDPTPMAICLERAPRVYAWVDVVDDLSGLRAEQAEWLSRENAREALGELLGEVGRVYVPALLANARAVAAGESQWAALIDGKSWEQPTFPYQAKCLLWIREAYAALTDADQQAVGRILADTGCEALLSDV